MFTKNLMIKLFLFSIFALLISSCAMPERSAIEDEEFSESTGGAVTTTESPSSDLSRGGAIATTPTPFTGTVAKVRGENLPIKIADNLKNSVEKQPPPKIWLEFDQGNGKVSKTELDDEFEKNLRPASEALFRYRYVIDHFDNPDERYDASFNHSTTFIKSLNEIRKLEIDSPDGKRKLTEDEINKIFLERAGLIGKRYRELDDHFNPKSSFQKFKESVNEKLGYSIF